MGGAVFAQGMEAPAPAGRQQICAPFGAATVDTHVGHDARRFASLRRKIDHARFRYPFYIVQPLSYESPR